MESSKKKQRVQSPCCEEGATSSGSSDVVTTASEVSCTEFPSLVFSIFVETADVKLLKTCRLVCKSWNMAACNVLRDRSCVKLLENNNKRSEDLKNLLVNRAFGPAALPSPFQNLNVSVTFFSDECFKTLVHMPNVVITTLTVLLMRNMDQRQLEYFLVAKGRQVKTLVMNVAEANDGFTLDAALMANEQIHLPALKRLKFSDVCPRNCRHFELIKKLIRRSALEEIDLVIRDSSVLTQMLTTEDLKTVRTFKLNFPMLSTEDSTLASLRMPLLTELTVQVRDVNEGIFQQFGTLFDSRISEFALAKFPALESINIRRLVATWRFLENDFIPHTRVTKIIIYVLGTELEQKEFAEESLHIFLASLSRQFPNTEKLSLGINAFNSRTFRDINYAFPRLKALGIGSPCDFGSMTGMKIDDVHYYMEAGWPIENIPRRNSIFDFVALESVDLVGSLMTVTNDMIIYCLAKIPTLKSVAFCWNKNLSIQEVRDCLGHLEKISIFSSNVKEFSQALSPLESMPNVHLC
ncbi:unnamed protein product [Allacma fusca]|uniref:F-box domain-containing protein n=1 Tax=Allacma fusca TaxID=39272 RepID=A0A8J2PK84_9HEXA|nr:unnamed protein product [Allacma fusca]